ncbi:deoxyribose-phosphate aldolase [Cutibacterium sp. V947]|uniref:deoxyribose-phosphate aldolase n=1 Tax=unclassified Cutibacterium TaxID=2649671 RepID=UPI003EE30386
MTAQPSAAALARIIDHTLLTPEATHEDVAKLVDEAKEYGTWSVCVSPSMLPLDLDMGDVKLAVVCGFPSGTHTSAVKVAEARDAIAAGADEVDMVINLGMAKEGRWEDVTADIADVKQAVANPKVLKVIIESAVLTADEIVRACKAAEAAGADFVKTSTGFHPRGGASAEAVTLMADTVGDRLGVKASGGIRDYETACAMIEAGATRLGVSSTATIIAGAPKE